jgi:hypothetical protein
MRGLPELKGMSEHTCNKLRTKKLIDFGSDRERGSKPVSRNEEWVLYMLAVP